MQNRSYSSNIKFTFACDVNDLYLDNIVEGYHSVRSILLLQNLIFLYKSPYLSMRRFMKIKCLITIGYGRRQRVYKA